MPTYSLTVVNLSSQQGTPTFAVFALLPDMSFDSLSTAWLTQNINPTNTYTFSWDITWGFAWSSSGVQPGYRWAGSGSLAADPTSETTCQAIFDYADGDFSLSEGQGHTKDGSTLWIDDTANVPEPGTGTGQKTSSVGVTLGSASMTQPSPGPVCVVPAGPNLHQTFTTHPTYYLDAGTYAAGQMVDGDSLTNPTQLQYANNNYALTAVLQADNTWSVKPTSEVNIAELLAA
jgi:hypothetical protein